MQATGVATFEPAGADAKWSLLPASLSHDIGSHLESAGSMTQALGTARQQRKGRRASCSEGMHTGRKWPGMLAALAEARPAVQAQRELRSRLQGLPHAGIAGGLRKALQSWSPGKAQPAQAATSRALPAGTASCDGRCGPPVFPAQRRVRIQCVASAPSNPELLVPAPAIRSVSQVPAAGSGAALARPSTWHSSQQSQTSSAVRCRASSNVHVQAHVSFGSISPVDAPGPSCGPSRRAGVPRSAHILSKSCRHLRERLTPRSSSPPVSGAPISLLGPLGSMLTMPCDSEGDGGDA